MPESSPAHPPLWAAWSAVCLPVALTALGFLVCLGGEDAVAAHFVQWRAANPGLARLVRLYTDWGNICMYGAYAVLLALGLLRRRADLTAQFLAYLAAQLLFSLVLERIFKISIGRPRPGVGGEFLPFALDNNHHSLPSGHTGEMTVQTLCLSRYARSLAPALLLGLVLASMGASRVLVGAHHPTDLLGGLCLGMAGGVFARRMAPRWTRALARQFPTFSSNGAA